MVKNGKFMRTIESVSEIESYPLPKKKNLSEPYKSY